MNPSPSIKRHLALTGTGIALFALIGGLPTPALAASNPPGAPQTAVAKPTSDAIAEGPFQPTQESLLNYHCPEWFRDAKFGIWAHWGPQAVPRQGDWYARWMYRGPGYVDPKGGTVFPNPTSTYTNHVKQYGHPSVFGYKDIIPLWKAEKWDPDALMALYKKAGAKYFVSMGIHHDNFALWNSPSHRWNAVNMGPKKDVVGIWQAAAKKQGLRFGVSEHLGASFTWFQISHGADATGPMAGVPYDGADPKYQDLYHAPADAKDVGWLTTNPVWQQQWFGRIKELVDLYHPDLLYSDSGLPFKDVGLRLLTHLYNSSANANKGVVDVVYNCKLGKAQSRWVTDVERGIMNDIEPYPWQTDTSIGDWFYRTGQKYKTSTQVIHMLADIVSKNGNLLINVVQTPEGDLEPDVLAIVEEIGAWMQINGEAIYSTRPWKVFGESAPVKPGVKRDEGSIVYTDKDLRFTTSKDGKTLYVIALGWPEDGTLVIKSLAKNSELLAGEIGAARLLGSSGALTTTREADGLHVKLPQQKPCASAYVVAITAPVK